MARPRRNRVREPQALAIAAGVGLISLAWAPQPTGVLAADLLFAVAAIGFGVWSGASAPWWALVAVAAVAAATAAHPLGLVLGLAGMLAALWVRHQRRDLSEVRAVAAGLGLVALTSSHLGVVTGLSSAVGVLAWLALVIAGLRRRPRRVRRVALQCLALVAVAGVLALVGGLVGVAAARDHLQAGQRYARSGLRALQHGNFGQAGEDLNHAARSLGRADRELSAPWARAGLLVPGVAAQLRAGAEVAEAGSGALAAVADAVASLDETSLGVDHGTVNLSVIGELEDVVDDMAAQLDRLEQAIVGARSWQLLPAISSRLDALGEEVTDGHRMTASVAPLIDAAPQLLGIAEPRRYLVMFTSPSEARGLGGAPGAVAVVTADRGQLALEHIWRTEHLDRGLRRSTLRLAGPAEFLATYADLGFANGPGGTVGPGAWTNLTASPHFPDVAEVAAQLYEAQAGVPVDGVFALDPYALAVLLEWTGPIQVADPRIGDLRVASPTVVDLLVREQYLIGGRQERVDLLEAVARATIDEVLTGSLDPPWRLLADLSPVVSEHRLVAWSQHASEQAAFASARLDGSLPNPHGTRGVGMTITNRANNELDTYLQRTLDVRTRRQGPDTMTVITATLANGAPAGLPPSVAANDAGLGAGWTRSAIALYSSGEPVSLVVDGRHVPLETTSEHGWRRTSVTVELAPGGSVVIEMVVREDPEVEPNAPLVTWEQPLVLPQQGP